MLLTRSQISRICPHAQALFDDPTYCTPRPQQVQEDEAAGESMMQSITVPELKSKQQTGWNPFIIDVRSDEELQQVRLATFDLHVIHDVANTASNDVPSDRDVVVMCRSGMRSQMAIMLLNQVGHRFQSLVQPHRWYHGMGSNRSRRHCSRLICG